MRTDRLIRRSEETPQALVSTIPVFVGLLVGGVLVSVSNSGPITIIGLGIVIVTFMVNDIWAVKRVLLAMIVLEIPIQVDVYINHDLVEAATSAISGYNISVTTVSLIALYGIWITEIIAGAAPDLRPILRKALPAIVYMAVVLGSLFVALDTDLVLYEATILFQALLVMLYVAHAVQSRRDLLFVLGLLMVGVLVQTGIASLTFALGSAVELGVISTEVVGARVAGTLGHPNSLGGYLALLLPVAAALVVAPVPRWYRWLAGLTFVGGTIVLGLSQSRGGFLGYMLGMTVLAVLMYSYRLVPRQILRRGALLAVIPLAVQMAVIGSRLADFNNAAARSRLPLIELAFTMIGDNTVWGVGANNFGAALDQYLTIDYSRAWISTVHNRYLLVWAETGVIGLAVFLWFLLSTLHRALGVVRSTNRMLALASAGLLTGVLAGMVHMTVDLYHNRPLVQLLWLMAGLVIAVERLSTAPASENTG